MVLSILIWLDLVHDFNELLQFILQTTETLNQFIFNNLPIDLFSFG